MALEDGVCAIVPPDQECLLPRVVGMGILVSSQEIVTCSHVIRDALSLPFEDWSEDRVVNISFPFVDPNVVTPSRIDLKRSQSPDDGDIGILVLNEPAPARAGIVALDPHRTDELYKVYGFRSNQYGDSHEYGEWVDTKAIGPLPNRRFQIDGLNIQGARIQPGFSGAGAYNVHRAVTAGIAASTNTKESDQVSQAITQEAIVEALGFQPDPTGRFPTDQPTLELSMHNRADEKLSEIEAYLHAVHERLNEVAPDESLIAYFRDVFCNKDPFLRLAFGYPVTPEMTQNLYGLVSTNDVVARPIVAAIAQRIYHLSWRFEFTLRKVQSDWAAVCINRIREIIGLCKPHLIAHQPSLTQIMTALDYSNSISEFNESAPDSTLYAVLRAIERSKHIDDLVLPSTPQGQDHLGSAIDFLETQLRDVLHGKLKIDDSSNAWWAIRECVTYSNLQSDPGRHLQLLDEIATAFSDIVVPGSEVARKSWVPEIYSPLRTTAYTLSNIQHILEVAAFTDSALPAKLHIIVSRLLDRLLRTASSNHLYLASAHHESLRNYVDYLSQFVN